MDAGTGRILYQKEADVRLPPASTTKIVTALVALESSKNPKELFRVTPTATRVPPSKIYLRSGQSISIEDLLYSVLLSSANDASLVLAEGIAGTEERFAELMNKKAREIGAVNSHFTNPHGLTAPEHLSTATDLAMIFKYAMKNPSFRDIIQTKSSLVRTLSGGKARKARRIAVRNHNRLLWNFDGAIGGKTGYTHAAQKCFVGGVTRNGVTLIVSILGSRNLWGDTKALLEYGFEHYDLLKASAQPPRRAIIVDGSMIARGKRPASALFTEVEGEKIFSPEGFVVQVASFRERERAELLKKQMEDQGFESFLEQAPVGSGESTYRVRVGPFAELLEAQEVAAEIEGKSGFRAIILPVQTSMDIWEKPG